MKKQFIRFLTLGILFISISQQAVFAQSWDITGNNNITPGSKLGTTNLTPLRLFTNNLERMHIDSIGRIGIGTSSPVNLLTVRLNGSTPASSWLAGGSSLPAFLAFGENQATGFNLATAANSSGYRPVLNTRRSRGTLAVPTAVQNNDYLASFVSSGYDGSTFQNPATIDFYVDGTPSPGNVPGSISFVTGSNASNRSERLRVGSTGNFNFNNNQLFLRRSDGSIGVGTTTPEASALLEVNSKSKGLLTSRMTMTQRNAITLPATGLLIYQTDNTPGFYYYNGSSWKAVASGSSSNSSGGWSLTGNAGTNPLKNFIGTTDTSFLVFKVNNEMSGYIDNVNGNTAFGYQSLSITAGGSNTALGASALQSNSAGDNNTATGLSALKANTEGSANTASGAFALEANTTGQQNTAIGYAALANSATSDFNTAYGAFALTSNTSGSNNTANGRSSLLNNTTGTFNTANGGGALYSNNTGSHNTASGYAALSSNTTGTLNTAVGVNAMYSNTTASSNTAVGANALYSNTTPSGNTAIGSLALAYNTLGENNTAIGRASLNSNISGNFNTASGANSLDHNTTGLANTANGAFALYLNNGSSNTATGFYSLHDNNNGYNNTANGSLALQNNTNGYNNSAFGLEALGTNLDGLDNTAVGVQALYYNKSHFNTAVGFQALFTNSSGYNNTAIGMQADMLTNYLFDATAIGAQAKVNISKKIRLGDAAVTMVESNAGSWTTSDGRFKTNVRENVKGLEFIKLLKPVTYNFEVRKFEEFLMQNYPDSIKRIRLTEIDKQESISATSEIIQSGFVAQDVAAAAKKTGYEFNGVHAPENTSDNWSLSYEKLVVPLVKAVQELSKQNDSLQSQINQLKSFILSKDSGRSSLPAKPVTLSSAAIWQNVPNPFTNNTIIQYSLPSGYANASMVITDKAGKTLKTIALNGSYSGALQIEASTLSSGAYQYALIVDGTLVGSKQMIRRK